jgi:hypothetical protein
MITNGSTVGQNITTGSDTYITGSSISTATHIQAGTTLRWRFSVSKTAAGTAAPIWTIRCGAGATITDTSMLSFTGSAQTSGTADTGFCEIEAVLSTGTATGNILGAYVLHHTKGASGFGGTATGAQVQQASGASVNVTGTYFGISVNPGASANWTFGPVSAQAFNTI